MNFSFFLIAGIFFFSGTASLIYEISWARQIALLFGHTTQSSGIVLGVFFFGMALGYWWASKVVNKCKRPLRSYALAEISIGLWASLIPLLLGSLPSSFLLSLINWPEPSLRVFFRIVIIFLVILPATIPIGYSFPIFAKFISHQIHKPSKAIVLFYALNTFGAFLGALLAATILIPFVGVTGCNYFAACVSVSCGLAALFMSLKLEKKPGAIEKTTEAPKESFALYALAIFSGFTVLGLEVLYIRLFALVSHNSIYNFSSVLCSFLVSLSLGSFIASHLKIQKKRSFFVWLCMAISIAIPISLGIFQLATQGRMFSYSSNFFIYFLTFLGFNFVVIAIPVVMAAMILPLCWQGNAANREKVIGYTTFLNTAASALGSMFATFIIISLLDTYASFLFFSVLYWCFSLILCICFYGKKSTKFAWLYCFALGVCLLIPKPRGYVPGNHEKIWSKESVYGPIEVLRHSSGNLKMTQNHFYTLGSSFAKAREKRQAHIPLLLHPAPKKVVFLGLGTGLTVQGALRHKDVKNIDVVELIPEVVEAAKLFHTREDNIFKRSHVQIFSNDARHYLYQKKQQNEKYDVIISDLFVPWHSQTGYLYTKEHYQVASECLNTDGIFCQWLPLYQLGAREFTIIADTFSSVFPHVSLWRGETSESYPLMALVGTKTEIKTEVELIKQRIKQLSSEKKVSVKLKQQAVLVLAPEDRLLDKHFFSLYVGEWRQRNRLFNSDEFPIIEFLTPITQRQRQLLRDEKMQQYQQQILDVLPRRKKFSRH